MNAHKQYIAAKADWIKANPNATPEQIEQACRVIAERLGL